MEQKSSKISKKLLNILRIMIYLPKKSFKKSNKLIFDIQTLLKGKIATKKALNHYYSALICKSTDNLSFVSPREYEFSCSNTPARRTSSKRKKNLSYDVVVVKKVIEILNRYDVVNESVSPLNLPGFGRNSPNYVVRQLRVTDSPFEAAEEKEEEDCYQVDKDCEDFIDKFYKELKNQRRIASESPLLQYRM